MSSFTVPSAANTVDFRWAGLAAAVLAALWFAALGQRALINPDEGRYATIALQMATSGDWVTPRLNGFLYFEKPPLQYWIGALAFKAFGVSEFSARFWPGLAGFLTVLAIGFSAARRWGREVGAQSFAIAGSTVWIALNSHFLSLDAGLTLFLALSLCAVLLAQQPGLAPAQRRRWIWLAWAAMAGATLSKGLIGILIPGTVLVLYSLWQRDLSVWRLHWLSGLAIFFALTAPWFVLVEMRNPGFAQFFFIHEHFERYLTTEHRREGAWWYFVPYLVVGLLPWTTSLPWLLRGTGRAEDKRPRALLVTWIVFIFVFFSISGSKLPSYILPIFPALAMLIALAIARTSAAALRRHLLLPAAIWLVIGAAATQSRRFASDGTPAEVVSAMGSVLLPAALIFLAGAALAWWLLGRGRSSAAVYSVAGAHLISLLMLMYAYDHYGQLRSSVAIAPVLQARLPADAPVFSLRGYDQTLPFYLRRNVVLVDYVDEFAYGEEHEPGRIVPTLAAFSERWRGLPAAGAMMDANTYRSLQAEGLPMTVVFEDVRRIAVVKP